jgi:hypothetical protein
VVNGGATKLRRGQSQPPARCISLTLISERGGGSRPTVQLPFTRALGRSIEQASCWLAVLPAAAAAAAAAAAEAAEAEAQAETEAAVEEEVLLSCI